jgi:hypothetical protein
LVQDYGTQLDERFPAGVVARGVGEIVTMVSGRVMLDR